MGTKDEKSKEWNYGKPFVYFINNAWDYTDKRSGSNFGNYILVNP